MSNEHKRELSWVANSQEAKFAVDRWLRNQGYERTPIVQIEVNVEEDCWRLSLRYEDGVDVKEYIDAIYHDEMIPGPEGAYSHTDITLKFSPEVHDAFICDLEFEVGEEIKRVDAEESERQRIAPVRLGFD